MIKVGKNKNFLLLGTLIATIGLTGCSGINQKNMSDTTNYDEISATTEKYEYFKDCVVRSNEVLLYNIFKDNIGLYNIDNKTWEPIYDSSGNNLFTYNVKGQEQDDTFYTIGSTSYNDFSVVAYNKECSMAESLYNMDESDSLIPIGYYNDQKYFIHNKNDLGDNETRAIAVLDNDKLTDVVDVKNSLLSNAVIINDSLYYTIYSEKNENFDLICYSFETQKSDTIKQIPTDQIFRYNDELLYIGDDNNLLNLKDKKFYEIKENSDIEIVSDYGIMLETYVDSSSSISCDIIDLNNNKLLKTVSDFDGYILNGSTLELYCEGNIEKLEL